MRGAVIWERSCAWEAEGVDLVSAHEASELVVAVPDSAGDAEAAADRVMLGQVLIHPGDSIPCIDGDVPGDELEVRHFHGVCRGMKTDGESHYGEA